MFLEPSNIQKKLKGGEISKRKLIKSSFNSGVFEKDKIETDKILMIDIKVPNSKTLLASKTFSSEMIA